MIQVQAKTGIQMLLLSKLPPYQFMFFISDCGQEPFPRQPER